MVKSFLIVAGEVSGDIHGAALIEQMKLMEDDVTFFGIGGDRMIKAGLNAEYHIKDMAFLGFAEVIKHLPFIRRVKKDLLNIVKEKNIQNIILIDYPGFNLNIAKNLKRIGKENFLLYLAASLGLEKKEN